ncbi:TSUP family transporter [Roseivirga pacifica]|nr:TSUP family transporter [Roseivirga pacifica]MCO6368234.1 TSUP family transporter [Roseivirga pacifica]MCO6372376.1 TSUP family transporter [Roseivirga pacifica]MCO6376434.1 TSUP family transporter [Roseivirga pacifica]MCO6378286.1 TSUP family transporter [Roseivirga pacifica]
MRPQIQRYFLALVDWSNDILLIIGGLLAGIVNTISGSGTLFSMGVMTLTGIPLVMANTTTRPGVFFQNLTGIMVLKKFNQFDLKKLQLLPVAATCFGAMVGAWCATLVSGNFFNLIASIVMVGLLATYVLPKRIFKQLSLGIPKSAALIATFLFLGGFYGGFIQIGVGILILSILSGAYNMPYNQSNTYKLIIILIYTIPTTLYFSLTDNVLWRPAILLAVGQIVGAYAAAKFISKNNKAHVWAQAISILMIIATLIKVWFY